VSVATSEARTAAPEVRTPDPHVIVLFGATGDLARRKLLPGLYHLASAGLMPEDYRIICTSRRDIVDDETRSMAREAVDEFGREPTTTESWDAFAALLSSASVRSGFGPLIDAVGRARAEIGGDARLLHYLSVPPTASADFVRELGEAGLNEGARIIMEKPFGIDLASARKLNASVLSVFDESQVFRIDHYLGREAVQNLLALRFANGMFEPVWNRDHVNHVQIDVPETLSIGTRGGFYDSIGAFRDMVVTHLFQVLGFVAMEPPTSLEAKSLTSERTKVFEAMPALDPSNLVRGQYEEYRDEAGVAPDSDTETFVALKAFVANWRWSGVPFYLRTGKRLAESRHLLTVAFSQPPRRMFPLDCRHVAEAFGNDHLTFELGDPGSISASFLAKVPGPTIHLGEAHMRFSYETAFGGPEQALEPYERLIHDVMIGDRTFFTTTGGIERVWEVSQPVLDSPPPVERYASASWGPDSIHDLIAPYHWHLPTEHV
jgi:glucose-6-phosphate 1-dehydrogenase